MTDPGAFAIEVDLNRLNKDRYFADCLATAANACYTNFRWLEDNDYNYHITLLDFDVICGAFPTLALLKATAEATEMQRQQESDSEKASELQPRPCSTQPSAESLENLVGPHKVNFHLQTMRSFTLPHGTVAELIAWKEKLTKKISEQAQRFIGRMERASSSPDPVRVLLSAGKEAERVSEVFRGEVFSLENNLYQMEIVRQILERQTPIEELLTGGDGGRQSGEAFRRVHDYLQARRPRRSVNNFNDAVNVTLLLRLFNSAEHVRLMPVLVSGTSLLTDYSKELSTSRLPRYQEPPGFIQNELYLTVAHSLLRFAGNRYANVINMALVLRQEADDLARSYRALLRRISSGGNMQLELKHVQSKLTKLLNHWGAIFDEALNSDKLDSVLFSNRIITDQTSEKLDYEWTDESHQELRRVRSAILERLEKYKTPVFDSLEIQLLPSAGKETGHDTVGEQHHRIELLFDISVVENDGRPLREVLLGSPISTITDIEEADDHRFVMHPKSVPVGALLSVDSWKDKGTGERRLEVVWPHKAAALQLWAQAVKLLTTCAGTAASSPANFLYRISPAGGRRAETPPEATTEEVRGVMAELLGQSLSPSQLPVYFEIQAGNFTFFADVEPLEDKELQAGLMTDYASLNESTPDAVARAMSKTSAVPSSTSQYKEILCYIFKKIGVLPK